MAPRTVVHRAALALLLALAPEVPAHPGEPEARSVFVRPGVATDLLASTTFGPVRSRDGGRSWGWLCTKAIDPAGFLPRGFAWTGGGALLTLTGAELRVSRDAGCSWQVHPTFTDRGPLALAVSPASPERVWVLTASPNAVHRSTDGALTFPTSHASAPLALSSLVAAPARGERVYAAGTDASGASQGALRLLVTDDAGASWAEVAPTVTGADAVSDFTLLAVSPASPDVVLARAQAGARSVVLRSADAGRTFAVVHAADDLFGHAEFSPDGASAWVTGLLRLYRSDDAGGTFGQLPSPAGNACVRHDGARLFTCGSPTTDGWLLATSTDRGASWTPLLRTEDVTAVATCPAGTPVADVCPGELPQLMQVLDPELGGGVTPPPPSGPEPRARGCASAPGAEPLALAAGLALLLRRRRVGASR